MTDAEALDEPAFLAAAAAAAGPEVAAFFARLFTGVRNTGMGIDRAAAATPTAVGWCAIDGAPSIVWVAAAGGAGEAPRLEVWLADLLARVASSPFREIVLALFAIPLLKAGVEAGDGTSAVVVAADLLAEPEQTDHLLSVFERIAAAGGGPPTSFRTGGGLYSWGERGEHGG